MISFRNLDASMSVNAVESRVVRRSRASHMPVSGPDARSTDGAPLTLAYCVYDQAEPDVDAAASDVDVPAASKFLATYVPAARRTERAQWKSSVSTKPSGIARDDSRTQSPVSEPSEMRSQIPFPGLNRPPGTSRRL